MTFRKMKVNFKTKKDFEEMASKLTALDSSAVLLFGAKEVYISNRITINGSASKNLKEQDLKEWEYHWKNLSEFDKDATVFYCYVFFYFDEDVYSTEMIQSFFDQSITNKTVSLWYPEKEVSDHNKKRRLLNRGNPSYPIYVISKGRSKTCVTADHLLKMGITDFKIVIEKQEWNDYAEVYGEDQLLELDLSFRDSFDTYILDFDITKSKGSGPARNFVWNHAKESGAKFHWIMDDNIYGFYYYNNLERIKAVDGSIFSVAEDFVNRYTNIGIAGLNYYTFVVPQTKDVPYVANTKIYSCLLIRNDLPQRWAGRYNEDVDLCIRVLKDGYATIQFDAVLAKKGATQTMGGGNTDAFYAEEGTLPKSNMLAYNHPDITSVIWRFSRWHHVTNYDIFDYYKDRTIAQTIVEMTKTQLVCDSDTDIIDEIMSIEFEKLIRYDGILTNVHKHKRDKIISVLKYYRHLKNNKAILDILMRKPLLDCDLETYYINKDLLEDTEDNRIMLDLLSLGNDKGVLEYDIDFESLLSYVSDKEKIQLISKEMKRNKYLRRRDIKQYTYDHTDVYLTDQEHADHNDSVGYIRNKLENTDKHKVFVSHYDKVIRGEIKRATKKTFKAQIARHYDEFEKNDMKILMVVGDEKFSNEKKLINTLNSELENTYDLIINSVLTNTDLFVANYALERKLKSKDFVPNESINGRDALKLNYLRMAKICDKCLIFCESTTQYEIKELIGFLKDSDIPYEIVYNRESISLDL